MRAFIGHRDKLTSYNLNSMSRNIHPKGIYEGGSVISGPGRTVRVMPFTAKSNDGMTIEASDFQTLQLPPFSSEDITEWYVVLHAHMNVTGPENFVSGTETMEWLFLSPADYRYSPQLPNLVVFSKLTFLRDSQTNGYPALISTEHINNAFADRINLDPFRIPFIGTANFSGAPNSATSITHNLGHTNYHVNVQAYGNASSGALGNIFVDRQPNHFDVYSTGGSSGEFGYTLTPITHRITPRAEIPGVRSGRVILAGTQGIRVYHGLGDVNAYFVAINVESTTVGESVVTTPPGHVWIEKGINDFTIKNEGGAAVAQWCLIPSGLATLTHGSGTLDYQTVVNHTVGSLQYFIAITPTSASTSSAQPITAVRALNETTITRDLNLAANVSTYADLPLAAAYETRVAQVQTDTGTGDGSVGNEAAGLYQSDGTTWNAHTDSITFEYLIFHNPFEHEWQQEQLTMGASGAFLSHTIPSDKYMPLVTYKGAQNARADGTRVQALHSQTLVTETSSDASNLVDLLLVRYE